MVSPVPVTAPDAFTVADRMRQFVAVGSGLAYIDNPREPLSDPFVSGRIRDVKVIPAYDPGPAPEGSYATVVNINAAISRTIHQPSRVINSIVSGSQPDTADSITIPANATLTGISGDATSAELAAGEQSPAAIASSLERALRTAAGGANITVDIIDESMVNAQTGETVRHKRFAITVPEGVSIRANGLTGNLAPLLGFDDASSPRYEAAPRIWAEVHDRVSVQWFREGAMKRALTFTAWVFSPEASELAIGLGLVVLGTTPLRDLSDLITEQWEERANVDVGFGYSIDVRGAGAPSGYFNPAGFAPQGEGPVPAIDNDDGRPVFSLSHDPAAQRHYTFRNARGDLVTVWLVGTEWIAGSENAMVQAEATSAVAGLDADSTAAAIETAMGADFEPVDWTQPPP